MSALRSPPLLINGNEVAKAVRDELKAEVAQLEQKTGKKPALAVVLVGTRKDSQTYVRMKTKACEELGIRSVQHDLPEQITQAELLMRIAELNNNPDINGILVQLPLPPHIDADAIIESLSALKDADGLTTANLGKLCVMGTRAQLIPCTPKGCIELLDRSGITIEGKRAVVVGRSKLVGTPVALLLMSRNATVTICHSKTQHLAEIVKQADILVAAIGKAEFVKGEWIKPGAAVIDVGMNAVDDATKKLGYRLVGDVEFEKAKEVAGAITPVPGGVGPMTVAMLLSNTVKTFKAQHGI